MLVFFGSIYLRIAISFISIQRKIDKNKASFLLIGIGAFIFIIYFLLKAIEGSFDLHSMLPVSNFLFLISQLLFLMGFLYPMITKK
jgi:hypothetical protein